jgi:hypothetical protein
VVEIRDISAGQKTATVSDIWEMGGTDKSYFMASTAKMLVYNIPHGIVGALYRLIN